MLNLFELFVKIGAKDEASGTISKITSGLGNGLKTAAKIGTADGVERSAGYGRQGQQGTGGRWHHRC